MTLLRRIALAVALAGVSTSALADKIVTYTVDPNHTQVAFNWNHVGFSTPGANFTQVSGTIQGNQDHPELSTVTITMPVKSLDTFVPLLNQHLIESGEFFKSKEFPDVTFKSTGMRDVNRDAGTFKLVGNLTVNGITKEEVLDVKLNKAGPHPFYGDALAAGFNATTTVKRSDFGIDKYVPAVSDELAVRISLEAIESEGYKAAMERMKQAAEKDKADKAKAAKDAGKAKAKAK